MHMLKYVKQFRFTISAIVIKIRVLFYVYVVNCTHITETQMSRTKNIKSDHPMSIKSFKKDNSYHLIKKLDI